MNKKNLIWAIIIGAVIIGAGVYYFVFYSSPSNSQHPQNQQAATQAQMVDRPQYSVSVPEGWVEVQAPTGASTMVVNALEQQTDPNLQKINFRTYYSVSYDMSSSTLADYVKLNKNSLTQLIQGVTFSNEKEVTINGRDAYSMDMQLTQQGVDFKVKMVTFRGNGNDIWILALNTVPAYWDGYQDTFNQVINSFTIK